MAICRVQKNKNYTTVANYCLRDKNLSLKAKGLLCLVLSLPEGWDYSIRGLVSLVKEEERAVKSTLKELKDAGYLQVTKTAPRPGLNFFTYEYIFYEQPKKENVQHETVQSVGVQSVGVQNSPVYKYKEEPSKEVVSKDELITDKDSLHTADKSAVPSAKEKAFNSFWEFYPKQRAGNKAKAEAAFYRAVKRSGLSLESFILKAKEYAQSEEVARGFAKGAAAWLNDDRFLQIYSSGGKNSNALEQAEREGEQFIKDIFGD